MIDYGNVSWPPPSTVRTQQAEWSAWYRGDHARLHALYRGQAARTRPSQFAGGVVGAVSRFFWGQPAEPTQRRHKVHVPIARDIANAGGDLLFGDAVHMETPGLNDAARARLDVILDANNLEALLHEAGVRQAKDVGIYLRVVTDPEVDGGDPIISVVTADAAIPTFRWGRLISVQFWHVVKRDERGTQVWRHIEEWRHGEVEHALYLGTGTHLGSRVPLTDVDATAGLAVDADSVVTTDGMCAFFVPNKAQLHDDDENLGAADYAGCIDELDAIDQCLTDWLRDVHAARARIIVPQDSLRSLGPGKGAVWDADQDVFVGLDIPPSQDNASPITVAQFTLDVDRHERTFNALLDIILRSSGYSPATFGIIPSGAMTATEVDAREQRSLNTREKKTRYWTVILEDLIDAVARTAGLGEARTVIEFPPTVNPSPLELAQTAQALRVARAASTRTLVVLTQPTLTPTEVDDEVARIVSEDALADPTTIGTPLAPLDGQSYDTTARSVKERFDALGVAIRAGVEPSEAAARVGLDGLGFTGAVPTSLRVPQADAGSLEQV